ncbi:MAG TPA: LytR family transcriptional regulator, partial [Candidatus Wirthbacteria bacterium]|nr:LytR family transcriptional regulator [Candidatus Wirthbacteria bacterium]
YPTWDYKYQTIKIEAGEQIMDGDTALKYVRSRHAVNPNQAGDTNRAKRQQQVMIAAKNKIIASKWSLVSDSVKLANLLDNLKDNLLTDIQLDEMLELANLVREIDTNNPRQMLSYVLGSPLIYHEPKPGKDWRYYARDPSFDQIRQYIRELLEDPFIREDMQLEAAKIRVQNGTTTSGLANDLTYDLRQNYGLNVLTAVSAERNDYATSMIIDHSNGLYSRTLFFLKDYLNANSFTPDELPAGEEANIVIILGADYKQKSLEP